MLLSKTKEEPVYYLSKKQLFNNRTIRKKANPLYLNTCKFFGATLIDRTHTLDTGVPFVVLDPISVLRTTSLSFDEICALRAEYIATADVNKVIRVFWSGGIDSTVTLIALIKYLKHVGSLGRLKVLLSKESIEEYPTFYRDVIEQKLDYTLISGTIYDHINDNEINVTGEHGDQLFGSDKLKYAILSGEAYRPYEDVLPYFMSRKLGTDKYTTSIIEYLSMQVKASPVEIKTYYDYLWWMNFSLKWQNVSLRLLYGLGKSYKDLNYSFFHFFQSVDFQNWSISNHHRKIKSDWKTYKFIAKDYIYTYHKDKNYFINKEKEPSLKEVLINKTHHGNVKQRVKSLVNMFKG